MHIGDIKTNGELELGLQKYVALKHMKKKDLKTSREKIEKFTEPQILIISDELTYL